MNRINLLKRKNKKGAEEQDSFISLILAVIAIGLLVFGIVKIYYGNVQIEEKNAKEIANIVEARINALESGQEGNFLVRSPCSADNTEECNWFIAGWGRDEVDKPDKCFINSCVCVCKGSRGSWSSICQDSGLCRDVNVKEVDVMNEGTTTSSSGDMYGGPGPTISTKVDYDYIPLNKPISEIEIDKTEDKIEVRSRGL
ncbi:MAG: hypothetical protein AABW80_03900 [Nanoarchaeota archaeon]